MSVTAFCVARSTRLRTYPDTSDDQSGVVVGEASPTSLCTSRLLNCSQQFVVSTQPEHVPETEQLAVTKIVSDP